jgi:monovalent cation/proton antiporter MnhG/PhaG subunit
MRDAVVIALLAFAVAITLWCTLGFLRARNPFARMHFLTPVSTLATAAVVLAIIVGAPPLGTDIKAVIVLVVTAITSAVTQHKLARAMWVRQEGGWKLPAEETR